MTRIAWTLAHQDLQEWSKPACHANLHVRLASTLHHNASLAILVRPLSTCSPFHVWTIARLIQWLTHRNSFAKVV
jgi:hypothetical protein